VLNIAAREPPCGQDRDEQAGADRHHGGKQQHAFVQGDLRHAREIDRRRPDKHGEQHLCDREAERTADGSEHHLFDDHVRDKPAAAGAKCRPDRHVAHAGQRPCERQVREVRTCNQ
jgi:hypothetical protein